MINAEQTEFISAAQQPWPANITARVLDRNDAAALEELRRLVVREQLGNPKFYRLDAESPDFPDSHLDPDQNPPQGVIIGLFEVRGDLIGYGALSLPGPNETTRADCLGLSEGSEQVAYLASAMLLAQWRGHGLHHRLIDWRLARALESGRRHAVAAFYPGNHQSWAHLAEHGLLGKRLFQTSGGLLRLVSHRDLTLPEEPVPDLATRVVIPVPELVDAGPWFNDGYWLWGRCQRTTEVCAELARPLLAGRS